MKKNAYSQVYETFWRFCNDAVTGFYTRLNICWAEAVYTKVKMSGFGMLCLAQANRKIFSVRRALLLLATSLFVSAPAWAVPPGSVNYFFDPGITRYEVYDYVTEFPGWSSNDLWQNNGFIPVNVPNVRSGQPTTFSPSQASAFGGIFMFGDPSANGPYVSTSELKFSFNPQGNSLWSFRWVQNLANANPDADDMIRDTFGWTVFSTSNTPILTLKFNNGDFLGRDDNNYNTMVTALRGDITSSINAMPSEMDEVLFNRGEWVSFDLNVDTVANTWSASIGSINNPVNSYLMEGVLNILAGTEVGAIAQIWNLEDSSSFSGAERKLRDETKIYSTFTGAGANTLLLESLSVQGVPEPSSASLVLFSSLALLAARRRRRSHS